ncbi:MAG: Uma2 family endonuclease [Campylobacterota bacterium]|nr:Uma2 family endonuclease [Campylobacterota bacterium]
MGALKLEYIPQYTYEEYKVWEGKWELIYGVPYAMSPAPMLKHQKISNKIARYLDEMLEDCKHCFATLSVDWKIDDNTTVQPDNMVLCHEPFNQSYIKKAPKVIFEVLSKSTMQKDLNLKYDIYEKEGVEYYVIVDPNDEFAKVYNLKDGRYIKVDEAHNDIVKFYIQDCDESFELDFSLIWE